MKKYIIGVTKMVTYYDSVIIQANCPKEARELALTLAKTQEKMEATNGRDKPRSFIWGELDKPRYKTEIVCK